MFFVKQMTEYEMRISDWSSDVCSSDLLGQHVRLAGPREALDADEPVWRTEDQIGGRQLAWLQRAASHSAFGCLSIQDWCDLVTPLALDLEDSQIGRASCRERVWQYV